MKKRHTYIRYSAVDGRPIFVLQGKSMSTAISYFCRVCSAEEQRYAHAKQLQEQACRDVILHNLNECIADRPVLTTMTPHEAAAAKALRKLADNPVPPDDRLLMHVRRTREENRPVRTIHLKRKRRKPTGR